MLAQMALSLILAVLFCIFFYIIGVYSNSILKLYENPTDNNWLNISGHTILGLLLTSAVFAIVITHGKTIFSGSILLIGLYRLIASQSPIENFSPVIKIKKVLNLHILLCTLSLIIGAYIFILVQNLPAVKSEYPILWGDYHYYAQISKAIGINGLENRNSIFSTYADFKGILLYHYLDLWTTDFICTITGFNHLIILVFCVYPLILAMFLTGLIGVITRSGAHIKVADLALIILAPIGLVLYFTFFRSIPLLDNFGLQCYLGTFSGGYKLFIIYALLIISFSQLMQKRPLLALFWILQLTFAYCTCLPAILGGTMLILLFYFIKRGRDCRDPLKALALVVFALSFSVIFDKVFAERSRPSMDIHNIAPMRTFVIMYIESIIKLIVVFSPAIIIVGLRWRGRIKFSWGEKIGWLFLVGSVLSSILFIMLNNKVLNSNQAIYNIIPPVMLIISSVSAHRLFRSGLPWVIRLLPMVIIVILASVNQYSNCKEARIYLIKENAYSKDYIHDCLHDIQTNNIGSRLVNVVSLNEDKLYVWYYNFDAKTKYLFYSEKVMECLDISAYAQGRQANPNYFDHMDSYDNYDNLIERWFKKKYPNNSFFDDEIMIDFLKTHQVKYLFASANYKFSNKVQEHLKLVSCDKETGGCFYRVNY